MTINKKERSSWLLRFIQIMRPISAVLLPNMIAILTVITKGYLELTLAQRTVLGSILSFAIIFCWIFGGGDQYIEWIKNKWNLLQRLQELEKNNKNGTDINKETKPPTSES